MSKYYPFLLFLVWLGYILITSILLFTNGFLLTRTQCDKNASFTPKTPTADKLPAFLDAIITEPGQIPTESKIILIVIDALRHDFAVFNKSLENPAPFQNKLVTIHELLQEKSAYSRLYQFIADPPTTTMQRLKGLTTGSLPTFIDAGSNFASSEINEDNIIDQLNKVGHNVICMGDDTWGSLYPGRFLRDFFQPSFNVWDLDTVDNEVSGNIFNEMEKTDWGVIIAHYLGVDHCGHRYGPHHPEMARKLTEMDEVIRKVVTKMDNKTILFVFGDHGMTNTGDHGGESESEVTAAMFVHSKQPLRDNILSNTHTFSSVKQVDLVPTIAHIMGIPIPYSNLGAVILNSLPTTQSNTQTQWLNTLHSIWSNVIQVHRYISEYENTTGSSLTSADDEFDAQVDFEKLNRTFKQIANENDFRLFAVDAYKFMKNVRMSCEKIWTQFDAFSMSRGLLLTSFVCIAVYLIINGLATTLRNVVNSQFVRVGYVATAAASSGGFILYYSSLTDNLVNTIYFATGLFAVAYLFFLVIQKFEQISTELHNSWRKRGWVEIISRLLFILSFLMVFTNSFIINEAKVMLFISVTLTIMTALDFNYESCFEVRNFTRKIVLAILFIICLVIRSSRYFWGCRDENNCVSILSKWGNSNKLQLFVAFCSLSIYVLSSRFWLRSCGNLTGYNINVLVAKCMPFVVVICCCGVWVVQHMPREQLVAVWQSNVLAWIIYACVILAIINVFVNPLHIYKLPSKQSSVIENKNVIPHLFKQMRDMFGTSKGSNHVPIVYGLATAYTSAFLIVALYFSLVYLLLLGDIVTPGGILMMVLACLVITLCAISRYEKSQLIENLLDVPFSQVLLWFALSIYAFYGTKHQPTFTNIVWESAFVGTSGTFTSNIIPATLVVINTFGSYILFGFALPLLVIAPFSLYVMFPSLTNKKHGAFKNLSKGDFTLYDFEEAFASNVFSVCCKYILCHTIRTFGCMLSATIHCRHLMVWAIFAPKLIFDALGTFLTILAVLLGYLLVIRIQTTLNNFVISIQKAR